MRASTVAIRISARRIRSACANGSSATSTSASPRHNCRASSKRALARSTSPVRIASWPRPTMSSKRNTSTAIRSTHRTYPAPRRSTRSDRPSARRSVETCRCRGFAPPGGSSRHRTSDRRSLLTTSPHRSASATSNAVKREPRTGRGRPRSSNTSSEPSTRISKSPPRSRVDGIVPAAAASLHRDPRTASGTAGDAVTPAGRAGGRLSPPASRRPRARLSRAASPARGRAGSLRDGPEHVALEVVGTDRRESGVGSTGTALGPTSAPTMASTETKTGAASPGRFPGSRGPTATSPKAIANASARTLERPSTRAGGPPPRTSPAGVASVRRRPTASSQSLHAIRRASQVRAAVASSPSSEVSADRAERPTRSARRGRGHGHGIASCAGAPWRRSAPSPDDAPVSTALDPRVRGVAGGRIGATVRRRRARSSTSEPRTVRPR